MKGWMAQLDAVGGSSPGRRAPRSVRSTFRPSPARSCSADSTWRYSPPARTSNWRITSDRRIVAPGSLVGGMFSLFISGVVAVAGITVGIVTFGTVVAAGWFTAVGREEQSYSFVTGSSSRASSPPSESSARMCPLLPGSPTAALSR